MKLKPTQAQLKLEFRLQLSYANYQAMDDNGNLQEGNITESILPTGEVVCDICGKNISVST